MSLSTKSHELYQPPTSEDVARRFDELNVDFEYPTEAVQEMANVYSHLVNGGEVKDAFPSLSDQKSQTIKKFMDKVDWGKYSGFSPLEKAASLVTAMYAAHKQQQDMIKQFLDDLFKGKPEDPEEGEDGEMSDGEADGDPEEGEGEEEPSEGEPTIDEEDMEEMLANVEKKLGEAPPIKKREGLKHFIDGDPTPENLLLKADKKQLSIISKLAILADRGAIAAKRLLPKNKINRMRESSQIAKVSSLTSMMLPTFNYKFVTKQLTVREQKQATKQCLIVMLDISGSMNMEEKKEWVAAILLDRALAVYEKKAVFHLVPFEGDAYFRLQINVTTKKQAEEFIKKLKESLPFPLDKGGTDIEGSLKQVETKIENRNHFFESRDYQIVIMNDGDDYVSEQMKPKYPTHGFILGQNNPALREAIQNSGGHFEQFDIREYYE